MTIRPIYLLAILGVLVVGGCDRDSESLHETLRLRQEQWQTTLNGLPSRLTDFDVRLARLPQHPEADATKPSIEHLRAETAVAGLRQSLSDVELQVAKVDQRVFTVGDVEKSAAALEAESAKTANYLQMLTQGIERIESQVSTLERSVQERPNSETASHRGQ